MNSIVTQQASGSIIRVQSPNQEQSAKPGELCYSLPLPAATTNEAIMFLEGLGGDLAGTGRAIRHIGINAPIIRAQYKREIEGMVAELAKRLQSGESRESVARWVSEQRRQIVNRVRSGSGFVTRGIYEIRDWREYGVGGRNYKNIVRRYEGRGVPPNQIHDAIIESAQKSNTSVNNAVTRGASYLRNGGKVLIVVGVAISAARIWRASDEELPKGVSKNNHYKFC